MGIITFLNLFLWQRYTFEIYIIFLILSIISLILIESLYTKYFITLITTNKPKVKLLSRHSTVKIKFNILEKVKSVFTQKPNNKPSTSKAKSSSRNQWIYKIKICLYIVANISLLSIIISLTNYLFFSQPYIIKEASYPFEESTWLNTDHEIQIVFNVGIRKDQIKLNMAPEKEASLKFNKVFGFLPISNKVTIKLSETFQPEQRIVTYFTGVSPIAIKQAHEYSIAFTYPRLPTIQNGDDISLEDIPINQVFSYKLDTCRFKNYDTSIVITPEIKYKLEKTCSIIKISPIEDLQQSQTYEISIYLKPYIINHTSKDYIDEYKFANYTYQTVKAPNLESFIPDGEKLKPEGQISITFNTKVDHTSVEEHFSLTPVLSGSISWSDEKTLVYKPNEAFEKSTKYNVHISKGFKNISGGISEHDIDLPFETYGEIQVLSNNPRNGQLNVEIDTKTISIQFDQEVDHTSAENKFSLYPHIPGIFSWSGNTMTYTLSSSMSYLTTYYVTIDKGVTSIYGIDSTKDIKITYTTKNNVTLLDVPWYKQTESFTCNIQAINMVLAYRGVYLGEQGVKNAIGIGTPLDEKARAGEEGGTGGNPYEKWIEYYGVYWTPASSLISNYRQNDVKRNWTVQELTTEIQKGNPSIIWWHNNWSPYYWKTWDSNGTIITGLNGMHSEVVVGFIGETDNPTHIYTNDPWRGKNRLYTVEQFITLWAAFDNTAIVVY